MWASGWFYNSVLFCMLMVPFLVYCLVASVILCLIHYYLLIKKDIIKKKCL